jgi:hypothetical protein
VKDKVTELNMAPSLLLKLPELMRTFSDSIETNIPVDKAIQLGQMAAGWDLGEIETAVIDTSMTVQHFTEGGADVLLPLNDKIRPMMERMFLQEAPVPEPPAPTPQQVQQVMQDVRAYVQAWSRENAVREQLAAESARIVVQNGTSEEGLALRIGEALLEQGFNIVASGDADRHDYEHSVIVDYSDKAFSRDQLVDLFQVLPENLRTGPTTRDVVDLRIIVGYDFEMPVVSQGLAQARP